MLLSNNPAITRIGTCRFQVTNIYNVKSFTNKLKPMLPGNKPEFSELMFTQWDSRWERYPQSFPKINHSRGVSLGQRDSFFALKMYKKDDVFFLRVADDWFVKYDGPDTSLVESDYQRLRLFIYLRVKQRMDVESKLKTSTRVKDGKATKKTLPKPRARPRARPRAKPRINRGKKLVKIALSKCNKKNVNRKKR